jgi:hypothetical protein
MYYNEFLELELSKYQRAKAERMAEDDTLAASVAGPDPTLRIATLVLFTIAVVLLFILI